MHLHQRAKSEINDKAEQKMFRRHKRCNLLSLAAAIVVTTEAIFEQSIEAIRSFIHSKLLSVGTFCESSK